MNMKKNNIEEEFQRKQREDFLFQQKAGEEFQRKREKQIANGTLKRGHIVRHIIKEEL